jgi:TRAP-type uncharacterized transport system fused permease subunit
LALIPAALYFLSVAIMVNCEARKLGLRGLPAAELPALWPTVRRTWYFFLPIALLVAALFSGASPSQSVFFAIRFSAIVLTLSGETLLLALVLIAFASLILGMGLPITAAYLVIAAAAAPALSELGLPLLTAHLIIFWLSLDSNITPPVALGAYTAAALAEADPWRTGWNSFRFAKMIYVMPLLFAYTPILFSGTPEENLMAIASAVIGTVAFSILSTGYFLVRTTLVEWSVLAIATPLAFIPTLETDIAAFALFGAIYLWQRRRAGPPMLRRGESR